MEYLSEVTKIIDYGLNSDQNKLISQVKIYVWGTFLNFKVFFNFFYG